MREPRSTLLSTDRRSIVVALAVLFATSLLVSTRAQFSRPVATAADAQAHAARSKFSSRESTGDLGSHPLTGEDGDGGDFDDDDPLLHHLFALDADAGSCGAPLSHLWTADAGASSIAATPLITDLFSDGSKEIVVPAFVHELEALDGASGARWSDGRWPAFHGSSAHASPFLADVDGDGVQDVLLATYDGQVSAYRDTGERIRLVDEEGKGGLAFPRLRVRTLWYEGLSADPTSHDRPDLGKNEDAQAELEKKLVEEALRARESSGGGGGGGGGAVGRRRRRRRSLMQVANDAAAAAAAASAAGAMTSVEAVATATFDELFGGGEEKGGENAAAAGSTAKTTTFADANDNSLSADSASDQPLQREQLTPDQMAALLAEGIDAAGIEGVQQRLANEAEAEIEAAENAQVGITDLGGGGGDNAELWGEERPEVERLPSREALRNAGVESSSGELPEFILVDAHVLATPVVADVDGDGHDELVAAVSYFYDDAEWPRARIDRELGKGVDTDKYVMAGAVAISLRGGGSVGRGGTRKRGDVVWASHLDSSTSTSHFQARALASPSVADVDRDGKLEVVITTTLGFVYILEGATGRARDGWPLQLAPVQASAALADVDGCGRLELIVADEAGTVAALKSAAVSSGNASSSSSGIGGSGSHNTSSGGGGGSGGEGSQVLWERHLGAAITATPALGDVDGDGDLEVLLGDAAGTVWCLDARTGLDANRWQHGKRAVAARRNALWPWKKEGSTSFSSSSPPPSVRRGARGRIVAAPLLVPLGDPPLQAGRHPPLRVVVPAFDGILYAISGDGACFDSIDLGEASYSRPLADDIDGDGSLEIVLATMSGSVHAVKAGRAGVSHRSDIAASASSSLHLPPLAAAALAAVSSSSPSNSLPSLQLDADDPPPADPLAVTAEAIPDGNRFVCSAPSFEGVRVLGPDRSPRDVRGRELSVRFEVVDRRSRRAGPEVPSSAGAGGVVAPAGVDGDDNGGRGPYRVTASLRGVGPGQMLGGGGARESKGSAPSSSSGPSAPVVGATGTYSRPGVYSLTLPVPRARTTATVRVEMVDEVRIVIFFPSPPPPPPFSFHRPLPLTSTCLSFFPL